MCHNEKVTSGSLNLELFSDPTSLNTSREGWERIVAKLKSGEMPPKGMPRPTAEQMDALLKYVQGEFEKADKAVKPDPGRVTARRLNRAEYANTIRDLLGVHFRANEEFPVDDSGYGFDNIADVLTVSPALFEKYMMAAERIAARTIGGDPMPAPALISRKSRQSRLSTDVIEYKDELEYDAEYIFRTVVTGQRGPDGKPVTLVMTVDGKQVRTVTVDTKETETTRVARSPQHYNEEIKMYLAEGPHTFRAEFINDEAFLKDLPEAAQLNNNRNIFPETIEIAGPYPSKEQRTTRKEKILTCDPATGSACVEKILTPLAHRAYRRPVTKAEVASLVKVFEQAKAAQYTPAQSMQFAIAAMLVSPQFLFHIERDPKPGTIGRISDVELASRLSYFLWSTMPDDELLKLAEANKLHNLPVLDAQVKRMIADPRADAFADNFAGQWLETRSLDAIQKDPKKFPEWGPELREAMRTETSMFFAAVMRENRPVSDFLDGKYSYLNDRLAKLYGIDGVTGAEFRKVELKSDQRSGVLTQASVMAVSSYPTRTSPVIRGKYLLENILGAPPPPPPADVPALNESAVGTTGSMRQTLEAHRANAVCASCHARMDVLGFGLENYDAIGRWRDVDGKFPVDVSGTFPGGKSFTTPAQMKELLHANMPEFTRCLTEKMLTYSLGRGVERYDRLTVQDIVRQTEADGYKFQTMVSAIIHSLPFQQRRGELKDVKESKDVIKDSKDSSKETKAKEVARR